jgi:hypothetical protein
LQKSSSGTQTHLHEISAYDFLLANMHALDFGAHVEDNPNDESVDPPPEDDHSDTRLINAAKSQGKPIPPGDIRYVMSKASTRHVNLALTQYHVSFHDSLTVKNLSLIHQVQMVVFQTKTCVLSSVLAAMLILKALTIIM